MSPLLRRLKGKVFVMLDRKIKRLKYAKGVLSHE